MATVRCVGCNFQNLYMCSHVVSFPDQRPKTMAIGLGSKTSAKSQIADSVSSSSSGKAHVGKVLHLAIYTKKVLAASINLDD